MKNIKGMKEKKKTGKSDLRFFTLLPVIFLFFKHDFHFVNYETHETTRKNQSMGLAPLMFRSGPSFKPFS